MKESGMKASEWMLAYRAIAQKPLDYFLKNEDELFCEHDPKYGLKLKEGDGHVYGEGDAYKSYFNLVTLDDKVSSNKRHFRAFVTFFIVHCLDKAGYFISDDINLTQIFITLLITLLILASICVFLYHFS